MAQSFLLVGGQIHMDLQCALIQPTGAGLEAYVLCTPSTLIALRNRDVDNCPQCVRPPA